MTSKLVGTVPAVESLWKEHIMTDPVNRRRFLKIGAATGVAACASVASGRSRTSANETVVLGVMGVNGRGKALALRFAGLHNVQIGYLCDVDSRALKSAVGAVSEAQPKAPATARDFRRILDDSSIDAMIIATPNHWHAPAAILSCAAKKHVYVEKPCSYTAEEGELLVAAARDHSRVVTMGTQRRSQKPMIQAMEQLHQGIIGNIQYARCWYANRRGSIGRGSLVDPPDWLDFDLWQGPAPRRPYKDNLIHYNWHWHWHWGNGELGNNGVHAVDLARWGMDVDFPTRVTSSGGRYRFDDDQETPDTQVVAWEFEDRAILWEGLSCYPMGLDGTAFGVSFHGDKGTMKLFDSGYHIYDLHNKLIAEFNGPGGETEHCDDFLNCIRNGGQPTANMDEAHKSTLLCHLGNIAQRSQRALQVDPATGHIRGDADAAKQWGREYAPGWQPKA